MNITSETILDLDVLLGNAPTPAQTEQNSETGALPESEVPPEEPSLHRRLCDELVAKARLIGWSDAELERLSNCESDDELLSARERVSRELSLQFSVPPLYAQSPDSPPQFRQLEQFK